nr:hypothetical protein CFP56_16085 [Quercus suber]
MQQACLGTWQCRLNSFGCMKNKSLLLVQSILVVCKIINLRGSNVGSKICYAVMSIPSPTFHCAAPIFC